MQFCKKNMRQYGSLGSGSGFMMSKKVLSYFFPEIWHWSWIRVYLGCLKIYMGQLLLNIILSGIWKAFIKWTNLSLATVS
jgi:hypothetical protein